MTLRRIESLQNPQFKLWEAVLESRGLKKHGRFLLAGRKSVPEALARWPERFEAVLTHDGATLDRWTIPDGVARYELSWKLFDFLDVSGTRSPLLVGILPEMPVADLAAPPRGLELVAPLGDPANLGALLRSAAAFGVSRVILTEEAAHPYHPKCLRASANAPFALELLRGPALSGIASAAGLVVALEGGGADVDRFDWPRDVRLVIGEEGQGVPLGLDVPRLAVPTSGAVESLNATVAASLALFGYWQRHRAG